MKAGFLEGNKIRGKSGSVEASRRRGRPPEPMEVIPAKFDLLLKRLKVEESEAAEHPIVKAWVKVHYRSLYIPEKVLERVGISPHSCL